MALTEGPDHRLMIRSSVGWSRDELAALPDVPLSSISRLLRPEHQREGCVLLAREEADLLTPPELHDVHRGQHNGRGPLAWRNHWLIVPLHDRDGAFTGIVWVDEPEDCLAADDRGPAGAARVRQPGDQRRRVDAPARAPAPPRRRTIRVTGLRNRRDLEPRIDEDIAASDAVSVLVCDLDDFRRVTEDPRRGGG